MDALNTQRITKINQVTPEVTWFLRGLGISDYSIIKIYELYRDSAIAVIKADPYRLLEDFPKIGFKRADEIAASLGVEGDDPERLRAGMKYVLSSYVAQGNSCIPKELFIEKSTEILQISREAAEDSLREMVYSGAFHLSYAEGSEAVYFYSYYRAESVVASRLTGLADQEAGELKKLQVHPEVYLSKYEEETGMSVSIAQRRAVLSALTNGVTVITGGPGTGKTTIINAIIYIMEKSGHRVAVCAPTGRAAKRIMETGGHPAQTVHRLLEYYYDEIAKTMAFARNSDNPLNYDAIIVDEASMMDIKLCEALADAVKDGTRLIFCGDKDQLPSVGAGSVLSDLLRSDYFNTVELKEIYRQDGESDIVKNAHRINRGDYPVIGADAESDFLFIQREKQKDIQDCIVKIAEKLPLDKVQVLTPVKKGSLGVMELNELLQQVFNPAEEDKEELKFGKRIFREGDRVMQIKNDYRITYKRERHDRYGGDGTEPGYTREDGRGIFNGEIGIICGIDSSEKTVTVAFEDDTFGRTWGRRYALYDYTGLDELELAYAVTVHKSQGSEYPIVIIPVSWFPPQLATRSLIYTAVTRGKEKVILVGSQSHLNAMVDNDVSSRRMSGLCSRITETIRKL